MPQPACWLAGAFSFHPIIFFNPIIVFHPGEKTLHMSYTKHGCRRPGRGICLIGVRRGGGAPPRTAHILLLGVRMEGGPDPGPGFLRSFVRPFVRPFGYGGSGGQEIENGVTFPEEMVVSGPKRRWNSLGLQAKRVTCETVPVLKNIPTLVRFWK